MSVGKEDYEAQILIGLSSLIQRLPSRSLLFATIIRKTELWSIIFDPILTTLLFDPDLDILLRRTNVVPEDDCASKIIRVQPDAMICEIDQHNWGCTIGYSEAKMVEPEPNIAGLANNLLRIAKSIGESKTGTILAFQIHSNNINSGYCVV
ncbi:hypothetical protein INT47_000909 [Mucor saturninus]|uniref:Uncharacterized protein n=1 Tax=Mucor saturninus TaxID=64648 RepID=A0A8H7RPM3_9FUNG|nr:hypothetical protein INT47_000909 [Mucor saturninus]